MLYYQQSIVSSCPKSTDTIALAGVLYIFATILCALPSCVLFRAAYQSLIGRVARYALSSDFGMHLRNSTQFEGN